jgi:homoserine O-acetyltransferase/O-succinyltransferase
VPTRTPVTEYNGLRVIAAQHEKNPFVSARAGMVKSHYEWFRSSVPGNLGWFSQGAIRFTAGCGRVRSATKTAAPLQREVTINGLERRGRMSRLPLPVTGAWGPGDDPGDRQFLTIAQDRPFALDGGLSLENITVAYETWGTLNSAGTNAVLICHAWTGDSHAASGTHQPGAADEGWWEGIIGPGMAIDSDQWFVVCPNVLGGCQGSTGPASPHPVDGVPYGSRFPVITVRDMVRVQARLADHLGVGVWQAVIGGSMGGMQALEWAITYPTRVKSLIPIATCMQSTAQQIAWGAIGRRAIRLDPAWRNGDYYDAAPGEGPWQGLALARNVAQVTFRSDNVFTDRFGRQLADHSTLKDGFDLWQRFEVERYLDHHGEKLIRRFDTNSYLIISKAMDLHDVGRNRGSVQAAMGRIRVPTLSIGIWSDMLYPSYQQRQLRDMLVAAGTPCEFVEIDSPHGHDAFLINLDQVAAPIGQFLGQRSI